MSRRSGRGRGAWTSKRLLAVLAAPRLPAALAARRSLGAFAARRSLAALAALAVLLGGCSSAIQEPTVRLDGISVGSLGLDGGTLRVRLSVANPNSFGLQADRLDYLIEMTEDASDARDADWDTLSAGSYAERITVEADDSAFVEIPVRFRYRDLGSALRAMLARGSFDYRLSGNVQLREPLRREIPFRRTGTIDELLD